MARIRTIKPEWLEDEIATLGSDARVMSIALILLADDYGNGRANDVILAGKIFPGEDEALERTRESLARLSGDSRNRGFITIYEVRGQRYYSIRNWKLHQKVDHPGKQLVPGPNESEKTITSDSCRLPRINIARIREDLAPDQDQDQDQDQEQEQDQDQDQRAQARSGSIENQAPVVSAGPKKKPRPKPKPDLARLSAARDRARSQVARKGAATRAKAKGKRAAPAAPRPIPPDGAVIFRLHTEPERTQLLADLDGAGGNKGKQRKLVKLVQDEVLRVYRAERQRVTGNSYVKLDPKSKSLLLDIGMGCIGYGFTPEELFTWWQQPKNNWTNMAFPSLGFLSNAKNLDRAAAAMGGKRRQRRAGGHGYDDPSKLDPRVREALRDNLPAGVDVDSINTKQLLIVQNAAKAMAAGRSPGMSTETEKLATIIKPLFEGKEAKHG